MANKALGKGLSALIPSRDAAFGEEAGRQEKIVHIPLAQIKTNKYQPRVEFNEEKLNELVKSMKEKGIIQPILVRKAHDGYELIAGERRLRAAKHLQLANIPAIVREVNDLDSLEISLIENIQREELNPIEEANAFERLVTEFNFTQDKIAGALGKDRSTIANTIRLLALPKKIQEYISKNSITAGHAKALLSLPTDTEQYRVCNLIIKKALSVRETEKLVARRAHPTGKKELKKDSRIEDIANQLQHILGTRVRISHGKKRGSIQIEYYSLEDLNRILGIILKK
jgi:ParB family transcriptional regulator, chromosome partitioning protein